MGSKLRGPYHDYDQCTVLRFVYTYQKCVPAVTGVVFKWEIKENNMPYALFSMDELVMIAIVQYEAANEKGK